MVWAAYFSTVILSGLGIFLLIKYIRMSQIAFLKGFALAICAARFEELITIERQPASRPR
jgi:hypothetical protein